MTLWKWKIIKIKSKWKRYRFRYGKYVLFVFFYFLVLNYERKCEGTDFVFVLFICQEYTAILASISIDFWQ